VYNGLSSFGAQNSCVSAALIMQGCSVQQAAQLRRSHREPGSVTRRR
jgi:hypothetical protein